ncbi:MAG: Ig-like domain-containing protein [Treponemataceae bacterium]
MIERLKKFILFLAVALFFCSGLFAKKYIEERVVENPESWKETFDVSEKRAGKYNVIVTAEDHGGNVTTEGPHNIVINPKSDLPDAFITNPRQNMHVSGNLNIAGTCVDDDAVDHVEIIFDDNKENPVRALGKEFWSYYLDTKNMEEGPHKITVYGIDINGVVGKSRTVIWHLDRHHPELEITNYEIGSLVSGKIKLFGTVSDGNGIDRLLFSLDGGDHYSEIKTHPNKNGTVCNFSLSIDTEKLEDGGTVCWFKTADKQGTVGYSTFLFFVDNSLPEVKIVSPKLDEAVNGKFVVAGYVKDIVGIQSLTWTWGKEKGEIELIPGNPYWTVELDMLNSPVKQQDFVITAVDLVGNKTSAKQKILIDNATDMASVFLQNPVNDKFYDGDVFVRGHAVDDDGVVSVNYTIDNGTEYVIETDGAFYKNINTEDTGLLSAGNHVLKIWATDLNGVKGNVQTVKFSIAGEKPKFSNITVIKAKGESAVEYDPGMEINPESVAVVKMLLEAKNGIKSLTYKFSGDEEKTLSANSTKNAIQIDIPSKICTWGFCELNVTAIDNTDRMVQENLFFYLTDLTKTRGKPEVVFVDNYVDESGIADLSGGNAISGYFVGGKASSVRFEPATRFASVSLENNAIFIKSNNEQGKSERVCVVVRTDKGVEYRSKPFVLKGKTQPPQISFNGSELLDGFAPVSVSGSVVCSRSDRNPINVSELSYRILQGNNAGSWNVISEGKSNFNISLQPENFVEGISVIEVKAVDDLGNTGAGGIFVRKITPPEIDKKPPSPSLCWVKGENYYYTCAYKGELQLAGVKINGEDSSNYKNPVCGVVKKNSLNEGTVNLEVTVTDPAGKDYVCSTTAKTAASLNAYFDSLNEVKYASGMEVVIPENLAKGETLPSLKLKIKSASGVSSVKFGMNDSPVSKTLKDIRTVDAGEYEVEIPLIEMKSDFNFIKVEVVSSDGIVGKYRGTVSVVRPYEKVENKEGVYWPYNSINEQKCVVLDKGSVFTGYANLKTPIRAAFNTKVDGITVTTQGKKIIFAPSKSCFFDPLTITVTDAEGVSYTSPPIGFVVDDKAPVISITSPKLQMWTRKSVVLSGNCSDDIGVLSSEYSIDGGETWKILPTDRSGSFWQNINLEEIEDGNVSIDVKATDKTGKTTIEHLVVYKKTKEPDVDVILPCPDDIINGVNVLLFEVDNPGSVTEAFYGEKSAKNDKSIKLDVKNYVTAKVGTSDMPLDQKMKFTFIDKAGNKNEFNEEKWRFTVNRKSDLPVPQIHVPIDGEVKIDNFNISGVVIDDDGACKIWYKIDNGDYIPLGEEGTSFNIPIELKTLTDNEHSITVYAEDRNGVKSDPVRRVFNVSLEEPKGAIVSPSYDKTVKGVVSVTGWAKDKNGIEKVQISVNNGSTWNDCKGTENWSYEFDTRVLPDGTHAVFMKVFDKFGIHSVYSNLINIDNTPPEINLELPMDGSVTTKMLFFSGETTDNLRMAKIQAHIAGLDPKQSPVPPSLAVIDLEPEEIIGKAFDLSGLSDGFYNIELLTEDFAGNVTRASRNIFLNKKIAAAKIDLLSPLNGETLFGKFNLYGLVSTEVPVESLILYVDGEENQTATLSTTGYFKFALSPENLKSGTHKFKVKGILKDKKTVLSNEISITYKDVGPWITIDNFSMGDFAERRPFIEGTAGYILSESEIEATQNKKTPKETRSEIAKKSLDFVELSWDNGKTFINLGRNKKWRYRIENDMLSNGYHFLVIKANMKNGESVTARTIVQIDKDGPKIILIQPVPGAVYNDKLTVSGLASDAINLKKVKVSLRSGDKANYEIPSFIQGLYLDWHFFGATLYDVGLGLTFFQDNVKLQFQFGQMTQGQYDFLCNWGGYNTGKFRYGGNVFGVKILANVVYLPLKWIFGPDWQWLSLNLALGANFSLFTETQSNKAQVLSAIIGQLEFPRITISEQKMFRTFSIYWEYQLWFIPTDVRSAGNTIASVVHQFGVGARINVF